MSRSRFEPNLIAHLTFIANENSVPIPDSIYDAYKYVGDDHKYEWYFDSQFPKLTKPEFINKCPCLSGQNLTYNSYVQLIGTDIVVALGSECVKKSIKCLSESCTHNAARRSFEEYDVGVCKSCLKEYKNLCIYDMLPQDVYSTHVTQKINDKINDIIDNHPEVYAYDNDSMWDELDNKTMRIGKYKNMDKTYGEIINDKKYMSWIRGLSNKCKTFKELILLDDYYRDTERIRMCVDCNLPLMNTRTTNVHISCGEFRHSLKIKLLGK